ncbi:MAG: helical backbone metal receptor [Deltaproteobacteria bacterium]
MAGPGIVSLVPSLTEAIVSFGLLDELRGRTRYCEEPAGLIEAVPSFGGTKNPDVAAIIELGPELVIVNKEENRIEDCQAFEDAGLTLYVTHPRTVEAAIAMLEELAASLGVGREQAGFIAACRDALELAECELAEAGAGGREPLSGFCPIWRRPWMTFADGTYIGDVLRLAGVTNVFGGRDDGDFFNVEIADLLELGPELVVLPDEPYAFGPEHAEELRAAGLDARFVHADGKHLSWYGPRIPAALAGLRALVADPEPLASHTSCTERV